MMRAMSNNFQRRFRSAHDGQRTSAITFHYEIPLLHPRLPIVLTRELSFTAQQCVKQQ